MKSASWVIAAGLVLILSGLIHAAVWSITSEPWTGALSIRKPILFGVSTGLTLVSLGWIQSRLKPAKYDRLVNCLFAVAMLFEVGLITLQYWRGEPSHFNHETTFGSMVDLSITCLIIFAAAVILDITRRSFICLEATVEMKLAIRAGLMFLVISCGIGFFILFYGEYLASHGLPPETFGEAGVMKFPHGATIHSIQYLPLLVWGMAVLKIPPETRIRLTRYTIASMATFLLFSLFQTFRGVARFDVGVIGGILLAVSFALIAFVVLQVARFAITKCAPRARI